VEAHWWAFCEILGEAGERLGYNCPFPEIASEICPKNAGNYEILRISAAGIELRKFA